MTTGNLIQTGVFSNKLYVPSEAVFETDSTRFVYLKKKHIVKQMVDTGEENEDYRIINKGVEEGDVLLLSEPEKPEEIETVGWDIYQEQQAIQKRKSPGDTAEKPDTGKLGLNFQKNL